MIRANAQYERKIQKLVNICVGVNESNRLFPGTLPVSLTKQDIPLVTFGYDPSMYIEYGCSFKADGEDGGRFMFGFTNNPVKRLFKIDRKFQVFIFPLTCDVDVGDFVLFDGEIMKESNMLLVFDTLSLFKKIQHPLLIPIVLNVRDFIFQGSMGKHSLVILNYLVTNQDMKILFTSYLDTILKSKHCFIQAVPRRCLKPNLHINMTVLFLPIYV